MDQDKEFLGKEPIGKLLLKLALPTVAAQLINMLYNIVDRIYIGHHSGDRGRCTYRCRSLYAAYYDGVGICSAGWIRRFTQSVHCHGEKR